MENQAQAWILHPATVFIAIGGLLVQSSHLNTCGQAFEAAAPQVVCFRFADAFISLAKEHKEVVSRSSHDFRPKITIVNTDVFRPYPAGTTGLSAQKSATPCVL